VPLVSHRRTIALDGKVAWPHGKGARRHGKRRGNVVLFKEIAGQHTFVAR